MVETVLCTHRCRRHGRWSHHIPEDATCDEWEMYCLVCNPVSLFDWGPHIPAGKPQAEELEDDSDTLDEPGTVALGEDATAIGRLLSETEEVELPRWNDELSRCVEDG
jgi:hypothetical protein